MLRVSYHAEEQMKRLSASEREELLRLLTDTDTLEQTKSVEISGRYVSQFRTNPEVVWQKNAVGDITVLTVIAR